MDDKTYNNLLIKHGIDNPKRHYNFIFKDISFKGKNMIDIGGGNGALSLYGIKKGLKSSLCIEPGSSGSRSENYSVLDIFSEIVDNLLVKKTTFQEYEDKKTKFDIILLNNSINHLDEEAYMDLATDNNSKKAYSEIFRKLSEISAPDAKIIITDCGRYNFFQKLNLNNPFAPTIDWQLHQQPEILVKLLSNHGFVKNRVDWLSPLNYFGVSDSYILNNSISYFYYSYFRIIMQYVD